MGHANQRISAIDAAYFLVEIDGTSTGRRQNTNQH